ncbi:hypothetical protein FLL45_14405 [Aliikangiella marina]|uniref:Lipoprotein n=1 Tax=Aliikangiella marina TaxID=1712262 RepID=A0A545TA13_9GAMM|nr:hypothetical protein [Aliikangiella marina]TQV74046.1 hypothetical protein FLL45_14405 [Aliikangiella marina]
MSKPTIKRLVSFLIPLFLLTGCPEDDDAKQSKSADNSKVETTVDNKDNIPKTEPQVSSSRTGQSGALSESAGGAEELKKDELYEVPNRFPEKELLKEQEKKQQDEKKEKEEPPR